MVIAELAKSVSVTIQLGWSQMEFQSATRWSICSSYGLSKWMLCSTWRRIYELKVSVLGYLVLRGVLVWVGRHRYMIQGELAKVIGLDREGDLAGVLPYIMDSVYKSVILGLAKSWPAIFSKAIGLVTSGAISSPRRRLC